MARAERQLADDVEDLNDAPEPTLRETIEAARDEAVARESADAGGDEARPASAGDGRERDESGRFKPRAAAGADASGQDPAGQRGAPRGAGGEQPQSRAAPAAGQQPAAAAQPPAGSEALAPQYWSPAAKAAWANIPPEARKEIQARELHFHRELTKQDGERQLARSFNELATKHKDVIDRTGQPPLRMFEDYVHIMRLLQSNDIAAKTAFLRDQVVRQGITPQMLFGGQPQPQGQPAAGAPAPIPPALQQFLAPALRTASEWNEFKATRERERQEAEAREQQQTLDEIVTFQQSGQAEFFDAVKESMIGLLEGKLASTLQEAYDMACQIRPDIRAELSRREAAKTQALDAKRNAALAARRRAGSVRGGVGGGAQGAPQDRSLREELQANFAEARARI